MPIVAGPEDHEQRCGRRRAGRAGNAGPFAAQRFSRQWHPAQSTGWRACCSRCAAEATSARKSAGEAARRFAAVCRPQADLPRALIAPEEPHAVVPLCATKRCATAMRVADRARDVRERLNIVRTRARVSTLRCSSTATRLCVSESCPRGARHAASLFASSARQSARPSTRRAPVPRSARLPWAFPPELFRFPASCLFTPRCTDPTAIALRISPSLPSRPPTSRHCDRASMSATPRDTPRLRSTPSPAPDAMARRIAELEQMVVALNEVPSRFAFRQLTCPAVRCPQAVRHVGRTLL